MTIFLINLLLVKERLKVYPHWSLQFEAFLSFHWADHQTIRLINLYFDGLAMLLYYFWMTLNESFKLWIPMTSMPDDSDVSVLTVTGVLHTKYKSPNSRIYLFSSNGGKTKICRKWSRYLNAIYGCLMSGFEKFPKRVHIIYEMK